jgi:protein TonB
VAEARQCLEQKAFSEARAKASEAIENDPGSADAAELLRTIDVALERRDRETQIEEGIARAKSFLLLEEFDGAIAILSGIAAEFPGSPVVDHWLEHVRTQEAESTRQRRLQAGLREARSLMTERRFNAAIVALTELSAEFSAEPLLLDLLDQACLAKERVNAVAQAEAHCQELCGEKQFEQALEVLDSALAAYPAEPTLTGLRREVEERWQEFQSESEVSKALSQVQWLLDQGRPDLAAQFLRDKAETYPGQGDLASRLEEIQKILPGWEMARFLEDTLGRVASLEQLQQWPVALTVVEEALETYPSAPELLEAAERLRNRLSDRERRKKLGRRLDAIRQKISIESWSQAFLLLEAAQTEFPGEPELELLRQGAEEGRRRSDSENIVREVRQCLADGEPERAQEILRKGLDALPADPAIQALQQELKADQEYREEWHTAQVLFGRRQFQKAEQILVRLASPDRPEIALLLEKVREARAASEEEDFYKHGREKALKLIQQRQFEPAADLLRNLLTLFPGDPILERDLESVQSAGHEAPVPAVPEALEAAVELEGAPLLASSPSPAPAEVPSRPVPLSLFPKTKVQAPVRSRRRWALIGALGLLLVSVGAAVWKVSRSESRVAAPAPRPRKLPHSDPPLPAPGATPDASGLPTPATEIPARDADLKRESQPQPGGRSARSEPRGAPALPTKPFTLPPTASRELQTQAALPPPPGAAQTASTGQVGNLPPSLNHSPAPTPPPPSPPAVTAIPVEASPAGSRPNGAAATPAAPSGGRAQEAQLLVSPKPILPVIARQQRISGAVNLEATVDATGKVKGVKVVSGHPVLSGAAVNAVLKWRYRPATLNGQPVETTVAVKVIFNAEKE